MKKYHPEVYVEVTGAQGIRTYFGGYVQVINERERFTVEFDTDNVIGATVACFNRELQKELDAYARRFGGALNDQEFTDAVRAGFCDYMERLFSGRMNR